MEESFAEGTFMWAFQQMRANFSVRRKRWPPNTLRLVLWGGLFYPDAGDKRNSIYCLTEEDIAAKDWEL